MFLNVFLIERLGYHTLRICNEFKWSRTFYTTITKSVEHNNPQQNRLLQKQKQHFNCYDFFGSSCRRSRNLTICGITKFLSRFFPKMNDPKSAGAFIGFADRFNGITVDSQTEYEEKFNFEEKLEKSLNYWKINKKRAIWFKVYNEQSDWIPVLIKHGFDFHHAKDGFVTLKRWLPEDEYANLPDYAHTLVGVGGLVINHEKMEILVITDRFAMIPGSWKLPGGYVDPREHIVDAAIREVLEETGIESEFRSMVSVRHAHGGSFGCSDLYFVIALTPKTFELKPCEREIARASWMPIAEYLQHPNVHETNRHFLHTYLDYERRGVKIACMTATHQILRKEYNLYYERILNENEKLQVPSSAELEGEIASYAEKMK